MLEDKIQLKKSVQNLHRAMEQTPYKETDFTDSGLSCTLFINCYAWYSVFYFEYIYFF